MNTLQASQCRKSKSAFTLIEIMVATVIMVILVGLVVQITSEVLKVWNRSSGKLAANAEARIAMDLLTQDLETAVFRNNKKQWLRVESPKDTNGPYGDKTVALKLFSPALDRDSASAGDICAIGYRLSYAPAYDGATDSIYVLYRSIATPQVTFDSLMGASNESTQDELTGAGWERADIEVDSNYLASNIVDFKVILYEDDGTGIANPVNWDPAAGALREGDYAYGGVTGGSAILITRPLLYADIRLTVLSDEGLKILDQGYSDVEDVVREFGEVFTRRVNFLARPL